MPSASSIAAVRKDTQRLRATSRDVVRGFHRCGQKRHTTTASYIGECHLTLPSLRSEKTHNDCELDQRMPFEDSIAAVRKDTQRREANALHLKRRELNSLFNMFLLQRSAESTSPPPKTMSLCRCL